MSGLDLPTTGTVRMDDKDMHSFDESRIDEFRNQNVGFVFQFHYLLPELTALENVLMPARKHNKQCSGNNRDHGHTRARLCN